jgi:rhamnose utilization protein RhaD (predicted bifunctional aldolase and dehydrogenase)
MSQETSRLKQELLALSHQLGLESRQLALLGEGNTSTNCGDGTFLVKASGCSLGTLQETDISQVSFDYVEALMQRDQMSEQDIEDELRLSLIDKSQKKPSVETFLHALCLSLGEAKWVGHTHTVSVNQALCSELGAVAFKRHIFPDVIVVCGRHVASIPYVDPGFALAKAVKAELIRFKSKHGKAPKLLLMENHGPVALGQTSKEVLNIMLMADKWAKTLLGTYVLGGPSFLPDEEADRIDQRLDEHYRRKELSGS